MNIFFYEAFLEEAQVLKELIPAHMTAGFTWKTIQERNNTTPPASLISIRTQSQIPTAWASHLSGILTRSTGYEHLAAYQEKCQIDIPCGYLPLYCNRAVAEQAAMLWLSLLRKLPQQMEQFTKFHRDGLTGQECEHKTLLVVGVGNIGFEVVRIAKGLGMEVLGVDIIKKHTSVTYVSIEEGLAQADVIVCAMNLTNQNRGYFNYQTLKQAKNGVIFVNIARGELSPSLDLLQLLEESLLGGVALDVYNQEKDLAVSLRTACPNEDKEIQATLALGEHPNVILTPHNAFNTQEAVTRKAQDTMKQLSHFFEKGRFLWPIPFSRLV